MMHSTASQRDTAQTVRAMMCLDLYPSMVRGVLGATAHKTAVVAVQGASSAFLRKARVPDERSARVQVQAVTVEPETGRKTIRAAKLRWCIKL